MRYIVDRFEGIYAVCETKEGRLVNIKRNMLPLSVKEADVIFWNGKEFIIDAEATQKQKNKIDKLADDLWIK